MVELTLDGVRVQAPEGATILEAADRANIYIPRLCSHPDLPTIDHEQIEPWDQVYRGSESTRHAAAQASRNGGFEGCLLCLVQIERQEELVRACVARAKSGMQVVTRSAAIQSRRQASLKSILATHPHACVQCAQRAGCALEPCSTNVAEEERCCHVFHVCELRKVAEYVGIPADTQRYRSANLPVVTDEPLLVWDHNLCIGCLRCVRMCRDVRKIDALGFVLDEGGRPLVGTRSPTLADSGCNFCLSCVEVCPTGTLRLKAADPKRNGERLTRCTYACPAGIDIPRYLREVSKGEFARAEAVIREAVPFPRVLGQVCYHPCEDECAREQLSAPVAICDIKRAASDHSTEPLWKRGLQTQPATGRRVAVIGAGPSGLTAAWFLRLKGHDVVVYDSQTTAGGWLRDGIPRYRLSREAVAADIDEIVELGIEFEMEVTVGEDVAFEDVRRNHDSVFVAAGARKARRLACDGADLSGVESGLTLLQQLASDQVDELCRMAGEQVVVIGGGNVAIDVARTAVRLGADEVHLYCLEQRAAMPAHEWEIAEAENEGVILHPGWGPTRMMGTAEVEQVVFQACVSVLDDKGRFAPEFDGATTVTQSTNRVLTAIGQASDQEFLDGIAGIDVTRAGTIACGAESTQTSLDGVFAGGEIVSGPSSVVEAVAHGRSAASEIDKYLGGNGDIFVPLIDDRVPDMQLDGDASFAQLDRIATPRLSASEAAASFDLVETGYTAADAVREAGRCLRCDLRLLIRSNPMPPEAWLALSVDNVANTPAAPGVYQLLDEDKTVYAIKGVDDIQQALSEIVATSDKAKYFLFDQDPMYSKRESELIQEYLQQHGRMPAGEGDDDLDDLF